MSKNFRLNKELNDIMQRPPNGFTAGLANKDNYYEWAVTMIGPTGTPYEGAIFFLKMVFPYNYPFAPPKITFTTPIYHCNISSNGSICLDILKDNWSPTLTCDKVFLSIASLLTEPNPNDPLVPDIAKLFRSDRKEHDRLARQHTIQYSYS